MVKKKIQETEEKKDQQTAETSENKDNTAKEQAINGFDAKSPEAEKKQDTPPESDDTGAKVSDKIIQREKELLEKLAEMQDKYLRLSAEFDNYRKRTLKEKIEITKFATEDLLLQILPVMDDFERAMKHMETTENCTGMKEGIDLIYTKFSEFLKQQGIKEIESLKCDFNVDLHDAVTKLKVDDESLKGKIVEVILKGYYLKDKVIRHSKVVIGE
ncbi:MAG TPA: nucleotide exchange factor GrpE [Bacteroidales bacterium]|jgi:molecular chaperone GrpE|nr:nucleotide exchange factor GrpE [Bacteroidales bacterium]